MSDKKYISPEHAIRNIMELKSIGHNVPTANAFFKPVGVISPPKGDEHIDGSEKIRASRNIAKERQSETMKEEEELSETPKIKRSPNSVSEPTTAPEPNYDNEVYVPKKTTIGNVAFSKLRKAKAYANQLKMGREIAKSDKKGTGLSTYSELPSEYIQHKTADAIAKISGDPDKAERTTKFFAKIPSTLSGGITDVIKNVADAGTALYQGKTTTAKEKTLEAGRDAALIAAGGIIGNKVAKFATNPEVSSAISKVKPPSFFGPQKVKPTAVAEPPAPTTPPKPTASSPPAAEAPKTGGGQPPAPEAPKTYKYQPNAGTNRGAINARETGARSSISARLPDASTSASRLKRVGPMGDGPTYAPPKGPVTTGPKGGGPSGGGGGGGTKIDQPSAPENVVGIKPPTETAPSNIPTAQLKTTGGAKPKPVAPTPQPAKPAPSGPQRRGTPQRDVPWRPAPAKPTSPAPAKPDTPKVPGMPEFKPFNPNKPFEPKTPANKPAPEAPKPKQQPSVTPPVPLAPVVAPPPVKKPAAPAPTPTPVNPPITKPTPGNRPDIGPTQQPSSRPLPKLAPAAATAPKLAPAAATDAAAAPKTTSSASSSAAKPAEKPQQRSNKGRRGGRFPFALPGLTPGQSVGVHQDSNVPVDIYKHVPKEYMTFEQTRYDIENVARPNSKDKVKVRSRQAEIIRKIVEEKKASKKNSTVIINPELKQQEPEQTK